jgi:hypothetical protein
VSSSAPSRKLADERTLRRLAAALRSGVTRGEALRRVGVSESTFYRELRRSAELRELIGAGEATAGEATERARAATTRRPARPSRASSGRDAAADTGAVPASSSEVTSTGPSAARTRRSVTDDAAPRLDAKARSKRAPGKKAPGKKERIDTDAVQAARRAARASASRDTATADAAGTRDAKPAGRRASGRASDGRPAPAPGAQRVRRKRPPAPAVAQAAGTPEAEVEATAPVEAVEAAPEAPAARWAGLTGLLRRPSVVPASTLAAPAPMTPGADQESVTGRRSLTAPSGADWVPPVAVLSLQLLVAIAVGASPVVILLVAVTTVVVLLAVQRARRVAPRRGYVAGVRYSETLFVPDAGATPPLPIDDVAAVPPAQSDGNGRRAGSNGQRAERAEKAGRADLDWVAASILRGPASPDEPPPPPRRRG